MFFFEPQGGDYSRGGYYSNKYGTYFYVYTLSGQKYLNAIKFANYSSFKFSKNLHIFQLSYHTFSFCATWATSGNK